MIDKTIINDRIAKIRKYLQRIKKLTNLNEREFIDDFDSQMIAERSLQIMAQAMLDIGNHIVAHHGWGKPETYRQIITILYQNGILTEEYLKELEGLAGLRNILVHDYLSIDPNIIYQDLVNGIEAIQYFIKEIEKKFG